MFGGGVEKWLRRIASATEGLARRGMRVDLGEMDKFMGGITRHFKQNENIMLGQRAPQMYEALGGAAANVRDKLMAPMKAVADAAIMQRAFSGGRGYFEGVEELETMGATGVLESLQGLPGSLKGPAISAVTQQPLKIGRAAARANVGQFGRMRGQVQAAGGLAIPRARAEDEQDLLRGMAAGDMEGLVRMMGLIRQDVNEIGIKGQAIVDWLEEHR